MKMWMQFNVMPRTNKAMNLRKYLIEYLVSLQFERLMSGNAPTCAERK